MALNSSDFLLKPSRYSADLQPIPRIIFWISLVLVLSLSLLDLIGWAFDLTVLKSIIVNRTPMKIITAVFFILSAVSVIIIKGGLSTFFRKSIIYITASLICLISLLTMYVYASVLKNGHDPALTGIPYLRFFLALEMRMAFLTSLNFLIIGCILFLLTAGSNKKTRFVNILIIPVLFSSYFVLVSYLLGVYSINELGNVPVALNTGLAFSAVCFIVLIMNPDSWIISLFTSGEIGFLIARKLLPTLILLPVVIGWIRIKGEHLGLFKSDEGVIIVAVTYTICFLVLVWMTSRSVNIIDRERMHSEEALRKSHEELENRIQDCILAEKELQSTKNYLENIINYANAPIIVWNTEKKIQLFNHAFENLTGYSSVDVIDKKLDILFPNDSLINSNAKIILSLTENWQTTEIPILTKDKEVRTVLWNSANIYDTDNKTVLSTIAQGHDITRRIAAEQELLKSKEKLDLALENGQIGIWEWDLRTDNFAWDKRMGRMFSLNNDPVPIKFNDFEKYIHAEDVMVFRRAVQLSVIQNIPLNIIFRTRPGNNGFSHISAKALVEKDSQGKAVKMSGVCFDITEMKKGAEKALFNLNEDLVRSNRELEQFAYVASHDLQEPLRMVSSFTQLLAHRYKDKLDDDANEFIQFAVDGAQRMQTLINDLLEYSRVETRGKNPVILDMNIILGQAISNLSIKIKEKNALITNDELPVVTADGGQMLQLFQNLISNAIKFCNNSPRIHMSSKEEPDEYIFSVKDNGIGIEPQYFNRIFQIFQRLHTREEYSGTGIGLAICRRIIERHGGKIWVESIPGQGAIFYFTLIKYK